jgi:hypothetical protein
MKNLNPFLLKKRLCCFWILASFFGGVVDSLDESAAFAADSKVKLIF